jgi:hypothetical protein
VVAAEVKRWSDNVKSTRKGGKKKEPLDQRTKDLLKGLSDAPQRSLASDYERSIQKAYSKKDVPQLGHQQQSPNICPSVDDPDLTPEMLRAIADSGLTVEQYVGKASVEVATVRQKFSYGQPLVQPHLVPKLSTQMRRFHDWYMAESKKGRQMISVLIKDIDYFRGPDEMFIDFSDIYEIYHQDALDVSLISCWVL